MEGFQPIISPARIDPLSGFSVTKLPDCKESVYNFFPPKLAKEINKWESKKMNEVWVEKQIDILLEGRNLTPEEKTELEEVAKYAYSIHKGQKRHSGIDYIIHPLRTLELVMEYTDDKNSWKAALLHDVIEDSKPMELIEEGEEPKEKVTKEIYERYGERVLELCLLSTKNKERPKIDSFDGELRLFLEKFYGKHENTHDGFIKGLENDIDAAIIKLCDRGHNIRTIQFFEDDEKIKKYIKETLKDYISLAHRLAKTDTRFITARDNLIKRIFEFLDGFENDKLTREVEEMINDKNIVVDEDLRKCIIKTVEEKKETLKKERLEETLAGIMTKKSFDIADVVIGK